MSLGVMELSYVLIMVVVTQIYTCVTIHRTVHQKENVNLLHNNFRNKNSKKKIPLEGRRPIRRSFCFILFCLREKKFLEPRGRNC